MFVLKSRTESFFYPIHLPVIAENGGTQTLRFDVSFRRISRTRLTELQQQQESVNEDAIPDTLSRDVDYMLEIADGWRHVQDEAGQLIPFSPENVRLMFDSYPQAAGVIVAAFFEATLGGGKRKN